MKIFALLLLVSCASQSRTFDYMFSMRDGTYICNDFVDSDSSTETYGDCEHVLYGTKYSQISFKKNSRQVTLLVEDAK